MVLCERYKIVRSIKSGGMGAVYLALDQRLGDTPCAVKAMLDAFKGGANEEIVRRKFQSESVVLSGLQHPGIPRVRDYFIEAGTVYIVMDFIEGENLELPQGEARPAEEVIPVALEVLDILVYLHGLPHPVVHCDIKPANIIREKETGQIKLVDFGLARALTDQKTQTVAGTLGYSAMEQLRGHAEPRSDLYSLGVTIYHLLTGQVPTFLLVPPIRESLPHLDPRLAVILDSATRMEADLRPASAQEMRQSLLEWMAQKDQPITQAELDRVRRLSAPGWRQKLQVLLRAIKSTPGPASPIFQEPCPVCSQAVASNQSHCPHCQHKLDPDPLLLGKTIESAVRFPFRQPARLLGCLFLMLLWLTSLRYSGYLVRWWPLALWPAQAILTLLWLGYPLAVANGRIRTGQPDLPAWGNGLLHLRRGLKSVALMLAMWGLPWLPLLPALGLSLFISQEIPVFWLLSLTLAVVLFVLSLRQCILWPWAWSSLADRSHLPTALDVGSVVQQGAAVYQGRLGLQLIHGSAWLGLTWIALHLFWPLAVLPATLGMLACADLAGSIFRYHFLRQLPEWPGCYRSVFGRSPSPFGLQAGGQPGHLYTGLTGWLLVALLFGALLPSRDKHRYPVLGSNRLVGYINQTSWLSIEPRFNGAFPFSEGVSAAPASEHGRWGYLQRNGKWLVEPAYEAAYAFSSDGLARIQRSQRFGYVDRTGQLTIDARFAGARDFQEGLASATLDSQTWGYIDKQGDWKIEPRFPSEPGPFSQGMARVKLNNAFPGNWGYIDTQGKLVLQNNYLEVGDFSQGMAPVGLPGPRLGDYEWAMLDQQGGLHFRRRSGPMRSYREDRAAWSTLDRKWGFLDLQGNEVVAADFDRVGDFHEGVAWVEKDEKFGYILPNGKPWLALQFDEATEFLDGLAVVRQDHDIGYLNHQGEFFWRIHLPGNDQQLYNLFRAFRLNSHLIGQYTSNHFPVSSPLVVPRN